MHYPRLVLVSLSLGLFAALPVLASGGDVASIALRDFNRNGKIDRAVITFANPSRTNWLVHSTSGLWVTYHDAPIGISDAFMASSADPAVLEVVLDENDPALPVDTSAEGFEVSYLPVGATIGVSDGATELGEISAKDAEAFETEIDQAPPILISSTPEPGAVDVLRADDLTLRFSEPVLHDSVVISSSNNPGGWLLTSIGDGRAISVQHDIYPRTANETFGVTAKDLAGNVLAASSYPNPFSFQTSSDNTPNPRTDAVFLMTSPAPGTALAAGEAALLAWYTNTSSVSTVRLSYSNNGGQTWNAIATVPAGQKAYLWYPPRLDGVIQIKAEARDVNDAFVNISLVGSLSSTGAAMGTPIRVLSGVETSRPTGSTAMLSVGLDRTPTSAAFSCNDGALTTPVQISGDRPVRLRADLSNLSAGMTYTCAFAVTDASSPSLTLSVPSFVAGEDTRGPELQGPAVISQFNSATLTARLTWTTDEASTATVSFGPYLDYGRLATVTEASVSHSIILTGLTPGKLHQARITSIDAKGNASVSKDWYFVFLRSDDLIKGSGPAVYWYQGGKRSAFPDLETYRSWFGNDFSKVLRVPDTQLGTIPLGDNVKMKAGAFLIKIQSDPKTYAVEPDGALRWIQTEAQARALYGAAWAKRVRDVDVSLFTDYAIGAPLEGSEKPAGYNG